MTSKVDQFINKVLIVILYAGFISLTEKTKTVLDVGLLLWNQSRLQWLGTKKPQPHRKNQEPVLSWNASYENLLGTSKRFPQPVPLSEMVDFLVDIWDQEGLYD
ncbi:hypothetical protein C2S52_019028 [Perilla frutescens var. hirtella]|nr:hypothetical protein C2S52_019028 [Perilla frutescens var. hirtella]